MFSSCLLLAASPGCLLQGSAPRHRAPQLKELAVDVHFYKQAKKALRAALAAEAGVLSADALAMVAALAEVNPTRPTPSEDADLWSGSFSLSSATLSLSGGTVLQRDSIVEVDDDGKLLLLATVDAAAGGDAEGGALSVAFTGQLRAIGDACLELTCEQLGLAQVQDADAAGTAALVAACEAALGLKFSLGSSAVEPKIPRWNVETPMPTLRLAQCYLDQELHVVRWSVGGGQEGSPLQIVEGVGDGSDVVVLFKPKA